MQQSTSSNSKRPIIFLGVGMLNTLLDFLFYTFLTQTVFKDGHNIALVGFISGTFALICAFLTHSLITWRDAQISHRTFLKFFAVTAVGLWLIRPFLLAQFIQLKGLYSFVFNNTFNLHLPFSYSFIANTGAFGFMVVILLVYNYFGYEKLVFTNTDPKNR